MGSPPYMAKMLRVEKGVQKCPDNKAPSSTYRSTEQNSVNSGSAMPWQRSLSPSTKDTAGLEMMPPIAKPRSMKTIGPRATYWSSNAARSAQRTRSAVKNQKRAGATRRCGRARRRLDLAIARSLCPCRIRNQRMVAS